MVRVTEGKELLTDVDTRVELVVGRKTLTVILQYSKPRGPGSRLYIVARPHHRPEWSESELSIAKER